MNESLERLKIVPCFAQGFRGIQQQHASASYLLITDKASLLIFITSTVATHVKKYHSVFEPVNTVYIIVFTTAYCIVN